MGVGANAGVGVLGFLVVVPGDFDGEMLGMAGPKSLTILAPKPNIEVELVPDSYSLPSFLAI